MIDPLDGSTSGFLDLSLSSGANLAASGLAYSATDGLLLLNYETSSQVGTGAYLYQIDLASGVAARVGPASVGISAGLTFGPTGLLYSWHRDLGLVIIDPATSGRTQVGVGPGGDFMQHLAALPDGSLMGVAQVSPGSGGPRNLFRISAVDGSQQLVATLGPEGEYFALGGLAYTVPEPSGGVLVALLALLARAVRSAAPHRVR